jgi:hypothetical protein
MWKDIIKPLMLLIFLSSFLLYFVTTNFIKDETEVVLQNQFTSLKLENSDNSFIQPKLVEKTFNSTAFIINFIIVIINMYFIIKIMLKIIKEIKKGEINEIN